MSGTNEDMTLNLTVNSEILQGRVMIIFDEKAGGEKEDRTYFLGLGTDSMNECMATAVL